MSQHKNQSLFPELIFFHFVVLVCSVRHHAHENDRQFIIALIRHLHIWKCIRKLVLDILVRVRCKTMLSNKVMVQAFKHLGCQQQFQCNMSLELRRVTLLGPMLPAQQLKIISFTFCGRNVCLMSGLHLQKLTGIYFPYSSLNT